MEKKSTPGPARYLLAAIAMVAAVGFLGPMLNDVSPRSVLNKEGSVEAVLAAINRPVESSRTARTSTSHSHRSNSSKPVERKSSEAWDAPENLARMIDAQEHEEQRLQAQKDLIFQAALAARE